MVFVSEAGEHLLYISIKAGQHCALQGAGSQLRLPLLSEVLNSHWHHHTVRSEHFLCLFFSQESSRKIGRGAHSRIQEPLDGVE